MDSAMKREYKKENMKAILDNILGDRKALIGQAKDKGATSWLISIPQYDQDLDMNKDEFRDALCL